MTVRSTRLKILGLLLLLGMAGCATQKEPVEPRPGSEDTEVMTREGASIQGTITDGRSGDALGYARVRVQPQGHAGPSRTAMTQPDGRFLLRELAVGRYRLEASLPRYVARDSLVEIEREGERLEVELALVPEVIRIQASPAQPATLDTLVVDGASIMVEVKDTGVSFPLASEGPDAFRPREQADASGQRPGIASRPGTLHVRGGRSGEVSFRIDGKRAPLSESQKQVLWQDLVSGRADELWVIEAPRGGPVKTDETPGTGCLIATVEEEEVPVPLEHTDVQARITGYIASVEVLQRFSNPFEETIEAEYVFPLPHDAAVNDFLMVVGERHIRGIIREKEEAREIYEEARQRGHVASLLEQERPNVFRQKVANIEPARAIDVELHYFNALPYVDDHFEFAFPLVVGPRFNPPGSADPIVPVRRGTQNAGSEGTTVPYLDPNERSGHDVSITVELDAGVTLEDLESANHAVDVERRSEREARIELAAFDRIPNKDFVLRYRVAGEAVKSEILVHREGDEGYFSMMLVPPAELEDVQRAPVEFVFVLDCSGSMRGWPMDQARDAMKRALRQLRPDDSFQIIRFSESASSLGAGPIDATEENVRRGLDYVERLHGSGGTRMIEGIRAALGFRSDPARLRVVSFMTDGYIGNEAEIFAAIAEQLGDARIFSFGVGKSVNRYLLEGMARIGRGAVAYIGQGDDLAAIDGFYRRVRHPALVDVEIDWGGMRVTEVFPRRLPDLFVGRPVLVHGRFDGHGEQRVRVNGRVGGRRAHHALRVDLDDRRERPALPLLWARSQIQDIGDRLDREADADLRTFGLELALDYNLMSRWTSFVAVDASTLVDEPGERTETVPVPVPEGVRHDTTVGGGR